MAWLSLTQESVAGLTHCLLSMCILLALLRVKEKTRPTWLLFGSMASGP